MTKADKERAKRVQAICAEVRDNISDNDGNAIGKYSEDKNMENYIVINGKKAELTEEQLVKLGIKTENLEEKYPAKFKVGDRVTVICSTKTLGRGEEYEGKIFTIKCVCKLSDHQYSHAQNIRAYSIGEHYVVYENELVLFKNEELFKQAYGGLYYHADRDDYVLVRQEYFNDDDKHLYDIGNYCRDEKVMRQHVLHETLNRLLWRASVIAGELDNPWNREARHYHIYYDVNSSSLKIHYNYLCQSQGASYFPTEESANDAIENIVKPFMKEHPDFVW